jgi:hypothetical protein
MAHLIITNKLWVSVVALVIAFVTTGAVVLACEEPLPLAVNASCSGSEGRFDCNASVTGGTAPYSYKWTAVTNASNIDGSNSASISGECDGGTTGKSGKVRVTVTDSKGATVSKEPGFTCLPFGN